MEFKVIIYIIIGVLYLFYSIGKKAQEKREAVNPPSQKTINPPTANPLEEITRELKRRQAELEARKRQQPQPRQQQKAITAKTQGKDILVHEKKKATFEEGVSSYEPIYEREQTAEDKIERGTLKLQNEGIYKTESITELEKREAEEEVENTYQFNAREAFIGSLIFERKF